MNIKRTSNFISEQAHLIRSGCMSEGQIAKGLKNTEAALEQLSLQEKRLRNPQKLEEIRYYIAELKTHLTALRFFSSPDRALPSNPEASISLIKRQKTLIQSQNPRPDEIGETLQETDRVFKKLENNPSTAAQHLRSVLSAHRTALQALARRLSLDSRASNSESLQPPAASRSPSAARPPTIAPITPEEPKEEERSLLNLSPRSPSIISASGPLSHRHGAGLCSPDSRSPRSPQPQRRASQARVEPISDEESQEMAPQSASKSPEKQERQFAHPTIASPVQPAGADQKLRQSAPQANHKRQEEIDKGAFFKSWSVTAEEAAVERQSYSKATIYNATMKGYLTASCFVRNFIAQCIYRPVRFFYHLFKGTSDSNQIAAHRVKTTGLIKSVSLIIALPVLILSFVGSIFYSTYLWFKLFAVARRTTKANGMKTSLKEAADVLNAAKAHEARAQEAARKPPISITLPISLTDLLKKINSTSGSLKDHTGLLNKKTKKNQSLRPYANAKTAREKTTNEVEFESEDEELVIDIAKTLGAKITITHFRSPMHSPPSSPVQKDRRQADSDRFLDDDIVEGPVL